jgi:hypothetical protein
MTVSPPPIVYDKAKYHFGSVHGHGLPEIHAYIHTGMFVGWLIDNALLDEEFSEECEEDIQRFLKREITAPQLFQLWDGALVDDMLSDEGNAFADCYFNLQSGDYIDEYIKTLCGALKSEFHVEDNWKNYNRIARVVSQGYRKWQRQQGAKPKGSPENAEIPAHGKKTWWQFWK